MSFLEALWVNPTVAMGCSGWIWRVDCKRNCRFICRCKTYRLHSGSISHSVLSWYGLLFMASAYSWRRLGDTSGGGVSHSRIFPLYYRLDSSALSRARGFCHSCPLVCRHGNWCDFISQTPGFNVELTNFLIGNILWVSPQ